MPKSKTKKWFTVCECHIEYRPHEVLAFDPDDAIDKVVQFREYQRGEKTPGSEIWEKESKEGLIYSRFEWFVNKGKKKWIKESGVPNHRPYLNYKKPDYRL